MVSNLLALLLLRYFGRKTLLIVGYAGMCASLVLMASLLGTPGVQQSLTLTFVFFFEISAGPIMWLYLAEILPASGVSVGSALNWIFVIAVSLSSPTLLDDDSSTKITFFVFGGFCALGLAFSIRTIKETKGKTDNELWQLY